MKFQENPDLRTGKVGALSRYATGKTASCMETFTAAILEQFPGTTPLQNFLATAGELTLEQRKVIVQQALILIEQNYANLPLKRAMHAVNPVQRLKMLLQTLEQPVSAMQVAEVEFHREITEIFMSVRDLHTNYLLPAPFNDKTAFLPFLVENYFEGAQRKYLVTRVRDSFNHPTLVPGVEILYWNGLPIDRAVMNNAHRYAGGNREARIARGVQTLTTKALSLALPPDEEWVVVGYRTLAGEIEELRVDWLVSPMLPSLADKNAGVESCAQTIQGLDLEQNITQRVRAALFAPKSRAAQNAKSAKSNSENRVDVIKIHLPEVFEARVATTPTGTFGYLRIRTFLYWPNDTFVEEFVRLISLLPTNGLIIDVRGNGGGHIANCERILQTLTFKSIEPTRFQFINTPLNLDICRRNGPQSIWTDLSQWVESMEQSLQTGAVFSAGFPITSPEACNAIGQRYFGPVILITDALCYSATDMFASGFQDHGIGTILGTDGNTGAGGANVWEHRHFVSHILPRAGSVYESLPNDAGMRVSIRRTLRVGPREGVPVEDLGVIPDKRHFLTRDFLLNSNVDLINKAGSMLAGVCPLRVLIVTVNAITSEQSKVITDTQGITRLDVYLGERPIESIDIQCQQTTFTITKQSADRSDLLILGFDGTELVARYRTTVGVGVGDV